MPPPARLPEPPPLETEEPPDALRAPVVPDEAVDDDVAEDEAAEVELTPWPAARASDARPNANIKTAVLTEACMDRPVLEN